MAIKKILKQKSGHATTGKDVATPSINEKKFAALSYIFILFLIPLLGRTDSKFIQFHAKQGLVLFVLDIIGGLFAWVPLFGQLFFLTLVIISVMGVVKAMNGEWWEIPFIHDWSKKVTIK